MTICLFKSHRCFAGQNDHQTRTARSTTLRLSDLKNINITYTPVKGKGKEKVFGTTDYESARRKIIVKDSEDDGSSDGSE